jgi:hypothetical protein
LSDTFFYKIYHGNLAFSAIEEENLGEVIDKTYFPLLNLIEKEQIKVGIELSGYSLEKILELRPIWIEKFKSLYKYGLVELVGSGYMQIIGPTVPYEVNILNQKNGLKVYKDILDITPTIAYVNEQVFSKSMIDIYKHAGYLAIAMEWNNAYSLNQDTLSKTYAFQPVMVNGIQCKLPILWTDSIIFQQFQRVSHKEILMDEYIEIIKRYLDLGYKTLPIYSSDLEIFNYRPGRFETEVNIESDEWKTISSIIVNLKKFGEFYLPSQVVEKMLDESINVNLTNNILPIIVKKQNKYSLSRWMACGRGASYINTLCYNYLLTNNFNEKLLLKYWGSDFRTHITEKKWNQAIKFLQSNIPHFNNEVEEKKYPNNIELIDINDRLIFEKDNYKVVFNPLKGMSLESAYKNGKKLQFGTVKHGDLDYISYGADFYTGTSTIESIDTGKIADLYKVENYSFERISDNIYKLLAITNMKDEATSNKCWIIDLLNETITLKITLELKRFIKGSVRLGTLTLLPQEKNSKFWYECKNGSDEYERSYITDISNIEHHQAKSLLQSSTSGIGVTDGILKFGIDSNSICEINIDKQVSYPFIMLQNGIDHDKYLTRVFFGLQEVDDTLKESKNRIFKIKYSILMN